MVLCEQDVTNTPDMYMYCSNFWFFKSSFTWYHCFFWHTCIFATKWHCSNLNMDWSEIFTAEEILRHWGGLGGIFRKIMPVLWSRGCAHLMFPGSDMSGSCARICTTRKHPVWQPEVKGGGEDGPNDIYWKKNGTMNKEQSILDKFLQEETGIENHRQR